MSNAKPSHGINFAYEQDPSGSPGSFTRVAEVTNFSWPDEERETTEVTPHEDTIDYYVMAGRVKRGMATFDLNFVYSDATHEEAATGLHYHFYQNTNLGFRLWGPDGQAGQDEIIASGYVAAWPGSQAPAQSGSLTKSGVGIQFSGPMKVDGSIITPL